MPRFEITAPDGKRFEIEAPEGATQEQALSYAQAQFGQQTEKAVPSAMEVAGNAAWKGLAGVGDMALNVAGSVGNALIPPPLRPGAMQDPLRTGLTAIGAIRPESEPQTPGQRILDMAVQTGVGMIASPVSSVAGLAKNIGTGIASGLSAGITKELTDSDLAATAVGMAVPLLGHAAVTTKANMPTLRNPVKLKTAQEGMAAGYVVPPSYLKPSFSNKRVESVAGKAAMEQEASIRNQNVTNQLAAKSIGLPEDTILDEGVLNAARKQAGQVYEEVQALNPGGQLQGLKVKTIEQRPMLPGPATGIKIKEVRSEAPNIFGLNAQEIRDEAGNLLGMKVGTSSKAAQGPLESVKTSVTSRGQDVPGPLQGLRVSVKESRAGNPLEQLKELRADATMYYKHYARSADVKSLKEAKSLSKQAAAIEEDFERLAEKSGKPDLMDRLREARTLIAKTHDIERALNVGDGHVSAPAIARMMNQGRPLTGELAVIGKFANAFKKVVREGSAVPSTGVSGTDPAMSAVLGTAGYSAAGGPAGLMAAGLPLLRDPARSYLLSKGYQGRLLKEAPGLDQAMLKSILSGRAVAESP